MLKVDLRQLERKRRLSMSHSIAADDPLWQRSEVHLAEPLRVQFEAQLAGRDVVVRGTMQSRIELPCRRCLTPVIMPVDEEFALVFRPGLTRVEAEEQEVFPLPERADELDLAPALLEQVVLSVPQYAMCSESCKGLCPQCGANLNQTQCDCQAADLDPRWAALRNLRTQ